MKIEIKNLKGILVLDIQNELTQRGIGGADFLTKLLQEYMKNQFSSLAEKMDELTTSMRESDEDDIELDFMMNDENVAFESHDTTDMGTAETRVVEMIKIRKYKKLWNIGSTKSVSATGD